MDPLVPSASLLLLLAGPLGAQPSPGDWLIADRATSFTQASLFYMPPASGAAIPWIAPRAANPFQWLLMSGNNRDLVALYSGAPNGLAFVTPAGTVQTLASFAGSVPRGAALDQDGTFVVSTQDGRLYRVPLGGPATLLLTTPPTLAGVTIDQDTGDYVLALSGMPGTLERVDRRTLTRSTFATGLGSMTSIAFEPRTGSFVVTDLTVQIRRISRGGQVSVVNASYPFASNSIKVDEENGNLLVVGSSLISLQTAAGSPILSSHLGGVAMPTGVEIQGSRKVSGFGPATPGSVYTLDLEFPASPGACYVAALSTGLRPGLPLPDGRAVNLDATSPLLYTSIGGIAGITTAFSGNLDGGGFATASIQIPLQIAAGVRVFASASRSMRGCLAQSTRRTAGHSRSTDARTGWRAAAVLQILIDNPTTTPRSWPGPRACSRSLLDAEQRPDAWTTLQGGVTALGLRGTPGRSRRRGGDLCQVVPGCAPV